MMKKVKYILSVSVLSVVMLVPFAVQAAGGGAPTQAAGNDVADVASLQRGARIKQQRGPSPPHSNMRSGSTAMPCHRMFVCTQPQDSTRKTDPRQAVWRNVTKRREEAEQPLWKQVPTPRCRAPHNVRGRNSQGRCSPAKWTREGPSGGVHEKRG